MANRLSVTGNDAAVSEIIGSILLISVVVIGVGIVGVVLMSHSTPQKIPALSAVISEETGQKMIYIYHDGGDPLSRDDIQILVDGTPQTFSNGGSTSWSTWSMGESLSYQYSGADPDRVQIVYTGGSGSAVLASSEFTLNPSGTATATATTTTTGTPVPVQVPAANFTGTPLSGTVPLTVQFTDLSNNTPTSWVWNFGDGDTANTTLQNPVHQYAAAGIYSVTLTATNSAGSNSLTRTNYITVILPPTANFTATPTSGPAPLTVQFTDTSTGTPASWSWSFGDGNSTGASQQNPVHTYTSSGNYTVSLTVTYAGYPTSTVTKTEYIQVQNGFINFIIDENVFVYGETLTFAGNSVSGPDATIVITGPLSTSDLNGGASLAVKTIYIDGDVYLDGGSASAGMGTSSNTGTIYVNGDMTLWNGARDIYGTVHVAGNLALKDAKIHGTVYVDGDVTLGWTPTLDTDARIYYTGTLTAPAYYSSEILAKCIKVASVPSFTMPDQTIAPVKSDDWYAARGYVSNGALTSGLKVFTDSYASTSWRPSAYNVIIIAKSGDITLTGLGGSAVSGVLYAPYGKVTFSGQSFTGVVIARDGFYVTSGGTTVTFTNLANFFSSPDDYPF